MSEVEKNLERVIEDVDSTGANEPWGSMTNRDPLLGNMAEKMKSKHDKYWGNIRNVNMMIFVAVILDPRYKLRFVEWSFERLYDSHDADFLSERVKETFNKVFNCYKIFEGDNQQLSSQISHGIESSNMTNMDDDSFALEFEKDIHMNEGITQNEVDLYLMEPLEKTSQNFDILNWWKVNSTKYHTLGQIAKDLLAMQVSTVASESAFSTGGRVLNSYRSSLTPKTVEALLCCQNWLRSTKLTTDVEELVEEFEKLEIEFMPPQSSNKEYSDAETD